MSPNITNETELNKTLEQSLRKILEAVSEEVYKKLRERILKDVYTRTNDWYLGGSGTPSYEFLDAWERSPIRASLGGMVTEIFYNSSNVKYDGELWKHGNPKQDASKNMAAILNLEYMSNSSDDYNTTNSGWASGLMFGDRHFSHFRRPYWSLLMKELFKDGGLEKMIRAELKEHFGSANIIVTGGFS